MSTPDDIDDDLELDEIASLDDIDDDDEPDDVELADWDED